MVRKLLRSIRQLLRGYVAGAHQPSPVFDPSGKPIVEPTVVSLEQRERLRERASKPPH